MAPRRGRLRDRRGRGARGPWQLAGPLAPDGPPTRPSRRDAFDQVVLDALRRLRPRWSEHLDRLEVCVEDVPDPGPDWSPAPLRLVGATPTGPDGAARVVVYRMPVLARTPGGDGLADLVLDELVEELARLWGVEPDEVDPDVG